MSLPLKDLLAAIADEIHRAGVAADINRSHWQAIYDDHELLREFTPSRVRISEAKLSIPLALDDIDEPEVVKPALTARQLAGLLPEEFEPQERLAVAEGIKQQLGKEKRHLLNRHIERYVAEAAARVKPDLKAEQLDTGQLERLQREYLTSPHAEQSARVQFRTSELEKIDPERIIRLELTLNID
ncbi:hypothetical protein [Motiliproteus sediminis]|uniref:hypothetical protein n=1 Tax=Motiliproteus sediminis TaxID=1468178 RepID=UPI001AEF6029|nr:hypothetical protein [Motiliproteus sediminis]